MADVSGHMSEKVYGTEALNSQKRSLQLCHMREEQRLCSLSHVFMCPVSEHPIYFFGIINVSMHYFNQKINKKPTI